MFEILLTREIKIRWHINNKNWYILKGYEFTNLGDEFVVKVEDISTGSGYDVECLCDYCNKNIIKMQYYEYYKKHTGIINKDCCKDCIKYKTEESNIKKYGVKSTAQIKEVIEKFTNAKITSNTIINQQLRNKGLILLTKNDCFTKNYIQFKCEKHINCGIQQITYRNFLRNQYSCKYCIQECKSGKTLDDLKREIRLVCDFIQNNYNRTILSYNDIRNFDGMSYPSTYKRVFKLYNESFEDYLQTFGFSLQKSGLGIKNIFSDGEETTSRYEYIFSEYLRNNLFLNYQKDYFRNVLYKKFINTYIGMMDCDYQIIYKNRTIYIEIAGIISQYKNNYQNDIPIISSKSKENYRLKLKDKEEMLKDNNYIYYFLFPCDLNKEYLNSIFSRID